VTGDREPGIPTAREQLLARYECGSCSPYGLELVLNRVARSEPPGGARLSRPDVAPLPTRERRGVDLDDLRKLAEAEPALLPDGATSPTTAKAAATHEQRDLTHSSS
jgi:hypothetical protein